jgi:hypothetical protein
MAGNERETRFLAWAGLIVAAVGIVVGVLVAALLPGGQAWMCRAGIRFACDRHDMKADPIRFREQVQIDSALGIADRDVLRGRVVTDEESGEPYPGDCVEPSQPAPAESEGSKRPVQQVSAFVRNPQRMILAELSMSYPVPDVELEIDINVSTKIDVPASTTDLWPYFGATAKPGGQRMKARIPAHSTNCTLTFLMVPVHGWNGVTTGTWPLGHYAVTADVHGAFDADAKGFFDVK